MMPRLQRVICACVVATFAIFSMSSADAQSAWNEAQMMSWVVLSRSHQDFDIDALRRKLDAAFPGEFLPPDDTKGFVVAGPTPGQFLIRSSVDGAAGLFLLHNVPAPYSSVSGMIGAISDLSLRRVAQAQCCWLAIDAMSKRAHDVESYRFIGRALAHLAPDDAAVLLHPTRPIAMRLDAINRKRLAAGLQPDGF